jgi:hypothetical protein
VPVTALDKKFEDSFGERRVSVAKGHGRCSQE